MGAPDVVMDTNVLVAGLRSRQGASHRFLRLIGTNRFDIHLSVSLVLEYEQAAKAAAPAIGLSSRDIEDVVDYLCRIGKRQKTYYLWRPLLRDPKDDMVLELAVAARCNWIVSYNVGDFKGADRFGLTVAPPGEFLRTIGALR